ncbi:MAG: transposase [Candidatus Omnitrophica bacterium]|nr:transposase [Candidatus Omnitrophota bacterium]
MARPYRLQAEHCFYHITSRGNERKRVFRNERDYEKFLEYLVKAKERYRCYVYAYVLMSNHYHLLIETTQANLSRIMHNINSSYTTYHNVKYKRAGHLFQGRYKSIVVEKESYYLELSRYIHLNPVRAKVVGSPEEYRWSSYRGYLSKKGDGCIDKEKIGEILAMDVKAYREFVHQGVGTKEEPFKEVYGGFILGRTDFIKSALDELQDQVEGLNEVSYKGLMRKQVVREAIVAGVEEAYGRSLEQIRQSKKRPMNEKKVLIYLLREMGALTNQDIGALVGMKKSAVSMAVKSLEEEMTRNSGLRKEVENIVCTLEG